MSDPNRHDIRVLNDLSQALLDSGNGYGAAAAQARRAEERVLFQRRGRDRAAAAADLQVALRGLGGEPRSDGSVLAKAQRAFTDIGHALLGGEPMAAAVEAAEEALGDRFDHALADDALSATTRETIRRARASLDQISRAGDLITGGKDEGRLFPY
ncbi:MAG: PA2169 family four-helix-bundle protein [Brevundimonas sp.]|uniref:PA2169 family four-helix-bundle protein n=1 Tax=Brevundimonas sp. TaxID=1871086 RepID=UPI0025B890A1|nr:PA2169 family four-helix-bundle protein [Brevundimonas sp.]MBX3476814.1 PA2169 family four-helix-bundle protein [Brevundimonas sp.]